MRPHRTYFERFREEVARYAEGVHHLGPPAAREALAGLPDELASFLRSFDGAELFVDAVTIRPAAGLAREDGLLVFGDTATGDRLALDERGRVVRIEEDTGEALVEGSSFARWLEGLVVAEGVIYDREGEFREDVFEDDGEDLRPEAIEKRERKLLKVDPEAPAPSWRLAKALERRGKGREARALLEDVVEREPDFAWAWFDLGRLRLASGDAHGAEDAFARAAGARGAEEHAAFFHAHAARAAARRGDDAARAVHAARALERDPNLVHGQKRAARTRLDEGAPADARELVELAQALAPRDLEVIDLARTLSAAPASDRSPRPRPRLRPPRGRRR